MEEPQRTQIWAHRGASALQPENSLAAFALAVELGAEGIELDVHLTRDNQVVVCHDMTMKRVSGENLAVGETDYADLVKVDIACQKRDQLRRLQAEKRVNWSRTFQEFFRQTFPDFTYFNPQEYDDFYFQKHWDYFMNTDPAVVYPPMHTPLLEEVFAMLRPYPVQMNIELKNRDLIYEGMEDRVIELVNQFHLQDRVIYSSFIPRSIEKLQFLDTDSEVGLLYSFPKLFPIRDMIRLKPNAIHPNFSNLLLPNYVPQAGFFFDCLVNVWTVNNPWIMMRMLKRKVHAIITDKPDVALTLRDIYEGGRDKRIFAS